MYKVFFITLGCKVNQYETECMKSSFVSAGFSVSDDKSSADVILINSCTVTGSGDSKSLYAVRKARKDNPRAVIVLTGCLPQTVPDIYEKIPEADIITGTKERKNITGHVLEFIEKKNRITDIVPYGSHDDFEVTEYKPSFSHTRAFVKIQDGCSCFCSYCIIPYARGRCRSKPLDILKKEINTLAANGYREIVLVGINLAFYGMEYGMRLADAVEECSGINGIERIRLGSIEPEMILDKDLERLSRIDKLCPQFHLSLQSGCGRTLKAMNRRYTPDEYYALTRKILEFFPDASFTTDIMTGFPEETDEDFEESLAFAEKIGFAKIHVFQYSPRNGTPAAKMKQIPKNIKEQRADRMKALGERLHSQYLERQVGKTVPVLFERENSPEYHQGYAPDYTLIKILRKNSEKSLRNRIFYVTIEESRRDYCLGSITTMHNS
ncbi:MAG: tRNA (N(6)-L-threonylcarbamoyladenosine(37)-C(2))-methylthiotransferase MtaB [Ruminococcus sp.]|nr:tRNA (N(6)-L-threonylcarbamoyladenosine(37)-C(2))-methylthiotransferase MtaB [Ruminococcus sp.]